MMDFVAIITDLHFIRPLWLLGLPLAVLIPLAWRFYRRPSGDWQKVCDAHLLRWLSVGKQASPPGWRGSVFAGVVLALGSLSLAGPSWQKLPDTSYSSRDSRVLVLDLSASMLAEDLRPNRLTQARFRLMDMLEATEEGQMGLVAYAGDAYVVSPLTSDMNTIANMLPALQPDIIPVAGSRADRALEMAAGLLEKAGVAVGELLLISDGADVSDARMAAVLAERGIITSVLAVGAREGAPIPSGSGFVSDAQGNVVITRLEIDSLAAVARAGNGRLTVLDASGNTQSPWVEADSDGFSLRDDALGERWKDVGPWLAIVLLPLVALGFRRGLLFLLPLTLLPGLMISPPAHAGFWDDLWQRRDQQAQAALREQRAAEAAELAVDPNISGEAYYRAEDYASAIQSWSQVGDTDALYNQGNALARAGEYDAAIAAYDRVLGARPDDEDALFNKALVEQLKQQQEQQQEGEDSDQQEGEQDEGEEGEGEPQEGEGESEQEGEPEEGEQGEPSQQEMEMAWSEEDEQAMEQWLRRIPDDPGGLLRRKFRNQHQRRGAPQDEQKKW
jgi:Ca-activated chloride channel family protein